MPYSEEIGLNVKDSSGNTPFALACQHGHTNTVQLLLEYSANIDLKAQNNMGWTPIMEACHSGRTEIVKLLLENCDSGKIGLNIKHRILKLLVMSYNTECSK